jgi:hypothetical protein
MRESIYDDYDEHSYDDDWWDYDSLYDDDLESMEELCKHVEEKFERRARRK